MSRQPVLFPQLEETEFCGSNGELVAQHDGQVFACNPDNARVYVFYHRELAPNKPLQTQELMPTQIPNFSISKISLSPKGQKILLWGERGLAVLDIPKRRRANAVTTARCTIIGERFFLGHPKVSAIDVKWHPGSLEDTHLVALTSDNILRVYSTAEPACAVNSYPLFNTDSIAPYLMCLNVSSGPSLLSAHAGSMVSFSFGQVLPHEEGEEAIFPVFVLEENSDVYSLQISLYNNPRADSTLRGPLRIFPASNESYEMDACALLCLQSNPTVLVVAALSGSIQHFALLTNNESDEEECLYLLETVELEVPTPLHDDNSSTQSLAEEVLSLLPDPLSRDRYFVRHGTGIHSIFLPAVQRLEHFVTDDNGELNLECECVAEHMLCVQPIGAGDPTCLFGCTVIQDPMLGSHLLVLISNAEFISIPLRSLHRETIPLLSGGGGGESSSCPTSPIKQIQKQLFTQRIQGILARTLSNPLLRCGSSSTLSQKALLELLMKSTQVFREEYVAKQTKARGELLHHMSLLQEQHSQHKADTAELQETIKSLTAEGESISRRSSSISKQQQLLRQRVTTVMREVQSLLPSLSTAEVAFRDEVKDMSRSLKCLQRDAEQLQEKLKFQNKAAKDLPVLSSESQNRVRAVLRDNDSRITALVSKLKNAQVTT